MTLEQTAFLTKIETLFGKAHADNLRNKLASDQADWFYVGNDIAGVVDRE